VKPLHIFIELFFSNNLFIIRINWNLVKNFNKNLKNLIKLLIIMQDQKLEKRKEEFQKSI